MRYLLILFALSTFWPQATHQQVAWFCPGTEDHYPPSKHTSAKCEADHCDVKIEFDLTGCWHD